MVSRRIIVKWGLVGLFGAAAFSFCNHDDDFKKVNPPQRVNLDGVLSKVNDFIPISTPEDFDKIRANLNGNYVLTRDLDFSDQPNFEPLGNFENGFNGVFNGNGYLISGVRIEHPKREYVSLWKLVNKGSTICNLELKDIRVNASAYGSVLVSKNRGNVVNCHVFDSSVYTKDVAGGLVSENLGLVQNSSYSGRLNSGFMIGGAVAINRKDMIGITTKVHINGGNDIGGLVGLSYSGRIFDSRAIVDIQGEESIGGGIGVLNYNSVIQGVRTSGKIKRTGFCIGGVVGSNDGGIVEDCCSSIQGYPIIGKIYEKASFENYYHHYKDYYNNPKGLEESRHQEVLGCKLEDSRCIKLK